MTLSSGNSGLGSGKYETQHSSHFPGGQLSASLTNLIASYFVRLFVLVLSLEILEWCTTAEKISEFRKPLFQPSTVGRISGGIRVRPDGADAYYTDSKHAKQCPQAKSSKAHRWPWG